MNTILWDYESVWPDVWPQNICRTLWPIFHGPVILLTSWKLFSGCTWYFGIMSQYDPTSDLKVFVGHCDLYFMVHWICLISWRLLMYEHHTLGLWVSMTFDLKCRSLWPIFHDPVILPYILNTNSIWWMNVILLKNGSVLYDLWFLWFLFFYILLWKTFVLLAKPDSGELRCPVTALLYLTLDFLWG